MKKAFILFIFFLLHHISFAERVDFETIKKVAVKVFIENYPGSDKDEIFIDRAIPFTRENDTLFYIFNFKQNGFVIISADNAAPPGTP
ncbi:MAG: Spi family protease inhibitor [Bacteroidota bacterium]